jgi:hypothetical protein
MSGKWWNSFVKSWQCVPQNAFVTNYHSQSDAQVLKDATLFFSRSTPNVANVIPIMDIINNTLTTAANDQNIVPAICTAAGLAKKTLNC